MKGYHTTTGPARCAMKVDLMKAYDSVRWDFVDATLIKMGFPRTVIDLDHGLCCIMSILNQRQW